MLQWPDQYQSKPSKSKPSNYLDTARHPFGFIALTLDGTGRIQQLFGAIYREAATLQRTVEKHTIGQLAWEKSTLEWEVEHLRKCCQDLGQEKAHVEGQLEREKHKWFPRFLNAIWDKTNTQCEACHRQCSENYLTQCFHLLCGECY